MKRLKKSLATKGAKKELIPNVRNQGHQGDVHFRKLFEKDGDLYVLEHNVAKGTSKQVLYMTKSQFAEAIKSGKKLKADIPGYTTIIAGEATHHHHDLKGDGFEAYEVKSDSPNQRRFLAIANKPTELEHFHHKNLKPTTEHGTAVIPAGIWEFHSQEETDVNGDLKAVVD